MAANELHQKEPIIVEADAAVPLSKIDETLLVKFAEDVAAQATRLDELAKQLITLCIAVPGIYAAVLKLVVGKDTVMPGEHWVFWAFLTWLLALFFSIASLLPERQTVDPDSLTEIQDYFYKTARCKYWFICVACLCSFSGIALAVFSIFMH
jgi:hypothetical protein